MSVSELLGRYKDSGPLMRWQAKIFRDGGDPDAIVEQAAGAGSLCHDMIESKILGRTWSVPDNTDPIRLDMAENGFKAFLDWWDPANVEILGTECPFVSEQYGYGGTPDAWAMIRGELCLLDWKTSKEIYIDYVTQLAAYAHLLKECKGIEVKRIHIVRVGKQMAEFEHKSYPSAVLDLGWQCFLTRLNCWRADKALETAIGKAR